MAIAANPNQLPVPEGIENRDDDPRVNPRPIDLDPLAGKAGGEEGRRLAGYWMGQVIACDDDKEQKGWLKRGAAIEKRYRDQRNRVDEEGQRRYNALWSNIQILQPALYGKVPTPICERRFRDKDPVGRNAAQMLERALRNEIEINGFNEALDQSVLDYLLAGRGTVWLRYEPEIETPVSIPPDAEQDIADEAGDIEEEDDSEDEHFLRETGDRIKRESIPIDFIQWTDFYTFPARARIWSEVVAIAKRCYMTRDQLKRRFGDEIGKAVPLQKDDRHMRRQEDTAAGHEVEQKAQVFEVWSKTDEAVFWVAEGYPHLCDRKDDPYQLEKFFPVPRPLYANPTNNTLVPVPDFIQYQDQAIQIDELTQRISMLAKACKVAGVYNAAAKSVQRLFNESVENELIPVDDWAAFADKGGVEGCMSLLPLKEIMGVLNELQQVRQSAIEDMDRLTGINDVMRGTTDERETLGGQRLKSNSTGTRLQRRQNEVARFARDIIRLMADIMCKHFSPQSLIEVSGAMYEEGLGTMDIPGLSMLNGEVPPSPGGPAPPQGSPATGGPLGQHPPANSAPSGPPSSTSPMGPAPQSAPQGQQAGGNLPAVQPPQGGMPAPQPPTSGFQGQMQPPPIPPELLDKMQGLYRIKRAIDLLRNEKLRGFRVDIEVDSTIYGDQQQDKIDRTAFITSVTGFLTTAIQISTAMPDAVPLLGKLLQFGIRGFPVGRDLEQAIEDFTDSEVIAAKARQQQMQNAPNPELMKAQAALMQAQSSSAANQMKAQSEQQKMGIEQTKAQAEVQAAHMQAQSDQASAAAEVQRQQIENQGELANSVEDTKQKQLDTEMRRMEMQIKLLELEIKKIEAQAKIGSAHIGMATEQVKAQAAQQSAHADMAKTAMGVDAAKQDHAHETEQHKLDMKAAKTDHEHETETHKMDMKTAKQSHEHEMEKGKLDIAKAKASANKPKPASKK